MPAPFRSLVALLACIHLAAPELPDPTPPAHHPPTSHQSSTRSQGAFTESYTSIKDDSLQGGEEELPQEAAIAFNDLVAQVASIESRTYSHAEWTGDAQAPSIHFAGQPSQDTVNLITSHPSNPQIHTDAPATRTAMDLEMEVVSESLSKDRSISSFVVSADPSNVTMNVDITLRYLDASHSNLATYRRQYTDILPELGIPLRYVITATSQPSEVEVTRGGKAFGGCTTAFTVRQGGSNGVLTAGHCSNYAQVPSGTSIKADYRTEHIGRYSDFQWHSTLDSLSRYISLGSAGTRRIDGYSILNKGTQACNYGKTRSQPSCGTVVNESVCVQFTDMPYVCSLVAVRGSFTSPGDSGGPWYIGNRALGIHAGSNKGKNQMYYSRVDRSLSVLRVNLYTK